MHDANRRLAGILAADVVGYSTMVGKDEPATLARVRTLRTDLIEPLAAAHGGRLFKTTGRAIVSVRSKWFADVRKCWIMNSGGGACTPTLKRALSGAGRADVRT